MRTSGKIEKKFALQISGVLFALIALFSGTANARGISSTSSLNFGTQSVGTASAAKMVSVTNTSFRTITVTSVAVSAAQFSYSGPALPATLGRGQTLTGTVVFTPTAAQSYAGTLTFSSTSGLLRSVSLSGTGGSGSTPPSTSGYVISAAPSSFTFTATAGGTAPATQSVVIDDTTPNPLPFTLSADQSWIVLSAAGGTTKATVTFGINPTGLAAGTYTGHVVIGASGVTNSPLSVPVSLTISAGTVTAPKITSQPASKTVTVGQSATFTVAATGSSPIAFQWKKNGTAVSGGTSSTLSLHR